MKFSKYHSAGNDFIITDHTALPPDTVRHLCHRRFGIGADGILFRRPAENAHATMRIMNSDGSTAEMCGNGLRCFVTACVSEYRITGDSVTVLTDNGPLSCRVSHQNAEAPKVTVSLGKPTALRNNDDRSLIAEQLRFPDGSVRTAHMISMGNPHAVCVLDETTDEKAVRTITDHLRITNPAGIEVNAEVVFDIDRHSRSARVIVNERGAGYTMACGTGGGAVFHALRHTGIIPDNGPWDLVFPGGTLRYHQNNDDSVHSTGTAVQTFSGTITV